MDHEVFLLKRLSSWIENKKEPSSPDDLIIDLRKEWTKTAMETDTLLQTSNYLQTAFSQIKGRYEQRS